MEEKSSSLNTKLLTHSRFSRVPPKCFRVTFNLINYFLLLFNYMNQNVTFTVYKRLERFNSVRVLNETLLTWDQEWLSSLLLWTDQTRPSCTTIGRYWRVTTWVQPIASCRKTTRWTSSITCPKMTGGKTTVTTIGIDNFSFHSNNNYHIYCLKKSAQTDFFFFWGGWVSILHPVLVRMFCTKNCNLLYL